MTKAATALPKYSSSDQRRERANCMMRQRVARAPIEPISDLIALEDAIPESHYRLDLHPADLNLLARMAELEPPEIGGVPYFRFHQGLVRDTTRSGERQYVSFSNYNYLSLSGHPALKKAVADALGRYGTSVSASRIVGGERPIHVELEGALAELLDSEACPAAFRRLRKHHKVFLMIDETHSLGVLGARGRGIREHFELSGSDVDIWMGTLSKSLASCAGYIAGSHALILNLKFNAPGFVFSVGLSPANAAAALAGLQ